MMPWQPSPTQPSGHGIPAWMWVGCGGCWVLFFVIVGAILFPVFVQTREKTRLSGCMRNVQNLSRAMQLYAQDNDEHFPLGSEWMDRITKYQPDDKFYHCPSAAGVKTVRFGYAFNSTLSEQSLEKVKNPRQVPMIYDSSNLSRNATDPVTSLPDPPRHYSRKGNVIGYVDGHARFERAGGKAEFDK